MKWREWMSKPEDDPFDKAVRLGQSHKMQCMWLNPKVAYVSLCKESNQRSSGAECKWHTQNAVWKLDLHASRSRLYSWFIQCNAMSCSAGYVCNFPYSPTGWQTRLVQFPELRRIQSYLNLWGCHTDFKPGIHPWVFKPDFSLGNPKPFAF